MATVRGIKISSSEKRGARGWGGALLARVAREGPSEQRPGGRVVGRETGEYLGKSFQVKAPR